MRAWLRMVHAFLGHPQESVYWGLVEEGATCFRCGAHWTITDYQI